MKMIAAAFILISSSSAYAGVCESFVTGLFTVAHNIFDRSGQSYGFAKVKNDIKRLAASNHPHEMPGSSAQVLESILQEFHSSRSVRLEEKSQLFEEAVKIFLAEANRRAGTEFFTNNVGFGNQALMDWIVHNAREAAGKPGIQKLFVDAIGKLIRTDAMWTRIMIERVLIELCAHPEVGFEPQTLQLFDRIALNDKEHITSGVAMLVATPHLRPILEKWLPRIEMEVLRKDLVLSFNEYQFKEDLRGFKRWLNGHLHNRLGIDGPNGYYDQLSMSRSLFHVHRENKASLNPLNNILYQVVHLRILLGLHNSDRSGPNSNERREPRFVEPALQGALAIMSYMSQETKLPDKERFERYELINSIPLEVQFRLLKLAQDLGTFEATEAFLKGNINVDPLRDTNANFSLILQ